MRCTMPLGYALTRFPLRQTRYSRRLRPGHRAGNRALVRVAYRRLIFHPYARSRCLRNGCTSCPTRSADVPEGWSMLRLPSFTYLAPKTLTEAVGLLAGQDPAYT